MTEGIKAIFWGFVQGVTEFLPISSSGHLVLLSPFLGELDLFFVLILHLGTLCAILTYYKTDIVNILKDFGKNPLGPAGPGQWVYRVALATLPSVAGAFFLSQWVKKSLTDPYWAGWGFILTGFCLILTRKTSLTKRKTPDSLKPGDGGIAGGMVTTSLLVGLAQVLAFFPGMSRSGWTIATALLMGFSRKEAMLFSFLLAIPAITGAMLFELLSHPPAPEDFSFLRLILAFSSSWFFGYVALKALMRSLQKVFFPFFAFYLWPLGLGTLWFFNRL